MKTWSTNGHNIFIRKFIVQILNTTTIEKTIILNV